MDLHVSLTRSGRLQTEVYEQLKEAILDGRLRASDALPATRDLARQLRVSRNTVIHAYEQLIAEGFLVARVGAGTFVRADVRKASARRAPAGSSIQPRLLFRRMKPWDDVRLSAPYDFQIGAPDPALFPWDQWRTLLARAVRGRLQRAGYPSPEGDPRTRAAIARHVGLSRSVRAGADDVLVTSGAQQALDLIGRTLIEPGTSVAVEDPGYPQARRIFRALGAHVVPVRVDNEGLTVAALPDEVRLVYVTPSHQFPLGVPMSLPRRLALLAWSERRGGVIVEDDYDSEFRFDGRPLEPLQSLDRRGRVLYIGTFSKVLLPTLRLGFLVAPATIMRSLRIAKALVDSHGPLEAQRALADFIDEGLLTRHVRKLLRVYRERRDRLTAAIERELGEAVIPLPSFAGLHQSLLFRDPKFDTDALVGRALENGVALQPLDPYYEGTARPGLALGYSMIHASKIDDGVRRLAAALRQRD